MIKINCCTQLPNPQQNQWLIDLQRGIN